VRHEAERETFTQRTAAWAFEARTMLFLGAKAGFTLAEARTMLFLGAKVGFTLPWSKGRKNGPYLTRRAS
jgi:hypothetical protein